MATKKKPEDSEVEAADLNDGTGAPPTGAPPTGAPPTEAGDPRDAEIARLREENERLKSGASGVYPSGQRYRVKLLHGPDWVVEPNDGEHPYEAYKRVTGVIASQNTPEITATDLPVGKVAA